MKELGRPASPQNYLRNRASFISQIASSISDGIVILPAFYEMQQTNDGAAPFIQESNFLWLTGIKESGWLLIIDIKSGELHLVQPERDEVSLIFDGGLDTESAQEISDIKSIVSRPELEGLLKQRDGAHVYTILPRDTPYFVANPAHAETIELIKKSMPRSQDKIRDARPVLSKLRAVKQDYELANIRAAVELTREGFLEIELRKDEFETENQVQAEFDYRFVRAGATHAYQPIVASGLNACTLHYVANNQPLATDRYLLIDIGALVNDYAADVTRSWQIGSVNLKQSKIYDSVKKAHLEIISIIKPGLSFEEYIKASDKIMKQAVKACGKSESDYRKYFPHAISHGLGLDTHDSLGGYDEFQPGMVLTVEPGIYIPELQTGVRIEDDILVTENGHENLSKSKI